MKIKQWAVLSLTVCTMFLGGKNIKQAIDPAAELCTSSSVNTSQKTLVPCGMSIGVTLSTDGVMIVDTEEIPTLDGSKSSPAKKAGLRSGDMIKSYNGIDVDSVSELSSAIQKKSTSASPITVERNGKYISTLISPISSATDNSVKIGAWVKDAAVGVGTMTYFDPKTKEFAALGHGICSPKTGKIISANKGEVSKATIVSVNRGEKGMPGELNGVFDQTERSIGEITQNSDHGIFGKVYDSFSIDEKALLVANRNEAKQAKAHILANIEGKKSERYEIEILKILPKAYSGTKGMIIQVTDQKLIEKTGGIVQGMSGSPILQNGKLIGAVTHVFVNDPTRGYAIFIEDMLSKTN